VDTTRMRTLTLVAGLAWLVVAGYGLRSAIVDDGDDWELAYMVFSVALLVGVALSVTVVGWSTSQSDRRRLRMAGLVVGAVGAAAAIIAWALPLWMTVLGVGFAMITVASGPRQRRAVALLAVGQLVGLAVMFAGIVAEVGRQDEYGDYPAAGGIALAVTATLTIIALGELTRSVKQRPVMQGGEGLAVGLRST